MKSLIRVLVPLLVLTGTYNMVLAQWGIGIRGGVNFASMELEEKIDGNWETDFQDFVPRINVGVIGEYRLVNNFALQPELNFIQKGYKTTLENGHSYDQKLLLNYLEIPILAKGRFGSENFMVDIMLGPSFGYALNGKVSVDDNDTDIDFDEDQMKRFDVGAVLGLGVEMKAGPGSFFIDGRVGWGITNLVDNDEISDHYQTHNRGILVGAGYIYRLGE